MTNRIGAAQVPYGVPVVGKGRGTKIFPQKINTYFNLSCVKCQVLIRSQKRRNHDKISLVLIYYECRRSPDVWFDMKLHIYYTQ